MEFPIIELSKKILFEITGYRSDQIQLKDHWEKDLGIDRVKRKKFAKRLTDQLGLSEYWREDFEKVTKLADLGLQSSNTQSNPKVWESDQITEERAPIDQTVPTSSPSHPEMDKVLFKIVQEKTGYPLELLSLDAHLEADLGIDSIKQIQIMSELRKHYSIPMLDGPMQSGIRISDFPTLRHWINYFNHPSPPTEIQSPDLYLTRSRMIWKEGKIDPVFLNDSVWIVEDSIGIAQEFYQILKEHKPELSLHRVSSLEEVEKGIVFNFSTLTSSSPIWEFHQWIQVHWKKLKSLWIFTAYPEFEKDGAFAGELRTLALELPEISFHRVELNRLQLVTEPKKLAQEIFGSLGSASEMRIDRNRALFPEWISDPLFLDSLPKLELSAKSVFLITGGGQGIGLEIAKDLIKSTPAHLILVGRTPYDFLKEKLPTSSSVHYFSCDVTRFQELEELGNWIRDRYGTLSGIIHAAGIIEDQRFEQKSIESFQRVYSVKTIGLRNLAHLGENLKAHFLCAFGSISGCLGNIGQSDYSAANAALKGILKETHSPTLKSFCIAWGPWDGVGMAVRSGIAELLRNSENGLISIQDGIRALKNELFFGGDYDEVFIQSQKVPRGRPILFQANHLIQEFHLDLQNEPWILDHILNGIALLPASFGIELMISSAQRLFPKAIFISLEDFKIHCPISIQKDVTLRIQAIAELGQSPEDRSIHCLLEILTPQGYRIAYQCIAQFSFSPICINSQSFILDNEKPSLFRDKIYPAYIPLGPLFQVIDSFRSISSEEAYARWTIQEQGFSSQVWQQLPRSIRLWPLEAAFQTAALMQNLEPQRNLLPVSIQKARFWGDQPTYLVLHSQKNFSFHGVFFQEDGSPCGDLQGYQAISAQQLL